MTRGECSERLLTQDAIVSAAQGYIGVPFKHAGRSQWGLDCVGLLIAIGNDLGMMDGYDYTSYGRHIDTNRLREEIERFCAPLHRETATQAASAWEMGDILLFEFRRSPQHVGILSGASRFVHACLSTKRVVEVRLDASWREHLVDVFRWRQFPVPEPGRKSDTT
jgi:cell wall-associated NlpC family hydrolase